MLGVLFVISFCVFNFSIWVPLLARNVLGQGVQEFGFLLAAVGVGAGGLAALALLTGVRRRLDRRRSTLASAIHMKASTE